MEEAWRRSVGVEEGGRRLVGVAVHYTHPEAAGCWEAAASGLTVSSEVVVDGERLQPRAARKMEKRLGKMCCVRRKKEGRSSARCGVVCASTQTVMVRWAEWLECGP